MATELSSAPQGTQRPGNSSYEARDANVKWIFGVVLFLICCGIVLQVGFSAVLRHLVRTPAPTDAWRPIAQPNRAHPAAPFPKLQISSSLDLQQFRASEDRELTTYGWVNRTSGTVRVPIERAMDIVLQKGLPTLTNRGATAGPSSAQLQQQRAEQWRNGQHQ